MTDSDNTVRPGRHRSARRLRKVHVVTLAGLAVIGLGLSVGTASADPTAEDWAKIRNCESGGNYSINTGNGYYGAYQFDLGTWHSVGGSGRPDQASPATQDALALALWRSRGWSPWACASLVSLSNGTSAPIRVTKSVVKPTPYAKMAKSTADRFTSHLFRAVLGRSGGASYSGLLQAGAGSRATVATSIATSAERRQQFVSKAYVACLGRAADRKGLAAHLLQLKAGTLGDLYVSLCSTPEAWARAHKNYATWANNQFVAMVGRNATAAEKASLAGYARRYGLVAAVRGVLSSPLFRNRQLDAVYRSLLGHPSDAAGRAKYTKIMSGRGVFSVTLALSVGSEFSRKS